LSSSQARNSSRNACSSVVSVRSTASAESYLSGE
jgi:hypothetical protein